MYIYSDTVQGVLGESTILKDTIVDTFRSKEIGIKIFFGRFRFLTLRGFLFSENVFLFKTIISRTQKLHTHVLYVGRGALLIK